ncbi:hypothetical protein MPER_08605, partial [Moniliophthora perniciosa FA553]
MNSEKNSTPVTLKRLLESSPSLTEEQDVNESMATPALSSGVSDSNIRRTYEIPHDDEHDTIQRQRTQNHLRMLQERARNDAQASIPHGSPSTKRTAYNKLRALEGYLKQSPASEDSVNSLEYDADKSSSIDGSEEELSATL